MSEPKEAWQCGACGEWHDDDFDAMDCCKPTIHQGWKCPKCGTYFDNRQEAHDCCEIYTCPECNSKHATQEEAEECHGRFLEVRIPPEQLERFGQQRLPL